MFADVHLCIDIYIGPALNLLLYYFHLFRAIYMVLARVHHYYYCYYYSNLFKNGTLQIINRYMVHEYI